MPAGKVLPADRQTRDKAKALFLAGVSIKRIGMELGLNSATVRVWASRYKWVTQKNDVQEEIKDKIVAKIDGVDKSVSVAVSSHLKRINDVCSSLIDRFSSLDLKKTHSAPEVATALKTLDDIQRRNLGLGDESKANTHFSFHLGSAEPVKKVFDAKVVTVEKTNTSENVEVIDYK